MNDLFERADAQAFRAITTLADALAGSAPITRATMNAAMTGAFGGSDAAGHWTQRDSFEILEQALARYLTANATPLLSPDDVRQIMPLAKSLPTQTVRSEEQLDWQQFSTPIDIAALMVVLAQPRRDDLVLEPSAGNGLLVAMLPPVASLHLNELTGTRNGRLSATFHGATVTDHDGATIGSTAAELPRPSLILMNPPFSRSLGRGKDDLAAVRHLAAALGRLKRGGRLVAIMPDWFCNSARMREIYHNTLAHVTVQTSIRLEKSYAKHGTGIDVRLLVIDKIPGEASPVTICRQSLAALLDVVTVTPRAEVQSEQPKPLPNAGSRSVGLFRAVKSSKPPVARTFRAPQKNDVLPVGYATLAEPAPLGDRVGVYLPYRPSRIAFELAGDHPTPLVESEAMGSIPAPVPTYVPHLPERCVAKRLLSAAQLETVVYAGEAWTRDLEGSFKPDDEGVGLKFDDNGSRYREGFFLGDGTGAGKGRQVAACILDNWLQGRRRAIWVSKNEALLDDARRDWTAIGGLSVDIQSLSQWKIGEAVALDEGVIFVSYPTLRSARAEDTRLDQLVAWAGPDFDGVIAFDEAHEMGGVAGGQGALGATKGSLQGICGVLLQNRLPRARILYASATGASDINNLAYAVRLGLWGHGTAFANREAFISSIRLGGIAAMELVARDLKATGRYTSRALSFAGVEYDILKHELTADQIEIYNIYADAWAIIHQNMEQALRLTAVVDAFEGTTLNSSAKAAARSRFESTKQRFFGQVLLSMKLPTVIAAVDAHLADEKSVVLQLVTTAESILDRRLGSLDAEQRADLDIDLSPREYIIDYLARAFPTCQMQEYVDDTGAPHSRPMLDADGNPVFNPEAEEARDRLVEHICALPAIRPALDALIERFGAEAVAEVTGRTRRIVIGPDQNQKLESRSTRTGQADAAAFMGGGKRILVFSDAGGTGRSYHASLDVENQQQRVHFLLEPGWRADRAIQGLGRTHRTHQASAPLFRPVTTDCKGELRFTSTIARRLDSLGALTRGQRQTGGQNLFDPADNLESEYAKAALLSWFNLLYKGKLKSTNFADFQKITGLELTDDDGVLKEEMPPIQRWLNRLLALRIDLQNAIFDEFLGLVEKRVSAAREAGTLDVGVETIVVEDAKVVDDVLLRTDPGSGATSHLLTIEISRRKTVTKLARILDMAEIYNGRFMKNSRSGKVALATRSCSFLLDDGTVVPRIELERPTRREAMNADDLTETAWVETDVQTFSAAWHDEAEAAENKLEQHTIQLATGLLLPIWSALPDDHLEVNRIADGKGNSWLGRLVFERDVIKLYTKLGLKQADELPPSSIAASVMAGTHVPLLRPFPMLAVRRRVNGQWRIELLDVPADRIGWLKTLGAWTEVLNYKTRIFVPTATGDAFFAALLK